MSRLLLVAPHIAVRIHIDGIPAVRTTADVLAVPLSALEFMRLADLSGTTFVLNNSIRPSGRRESSVMLRGYPDNAERPLRQHPGEFAVRLPMVRVLLDSYPLKYK